MFNQVKENDATIVFSYIFEDLFNNCSTKISYKSRNVVQDEMVAEQITLMDDDKQVFRANMPSILADIYERVMKLSSGVENAFKHVEAVEAVEGSPAVGTPGEDGYVPGVEPVEGVEEHMEITIQNNAAYNSNLLGLIDSSLYTCIETGSIKAWYEVCGMTALEQEYTTKYLASLTELSRRMFQLKKKTIKSTLGTSAS